MESRIKWIARGLSQILFYIGINYLDEGGQDDIKLEEAANPSVEKEKIPERSGQADMNRMKFNRKFFSPSISGKKKNERHKCRTEILAWQ